jgi:recombinational DNA repair protein (RecF pathway)
LQGFVLNIRKVKNEDLLVTVLTERKIKKLYRFYGVRHSAINLGFKIDFVAEAVQNKNILRMRDLMHLGFSWMHDSARLAIWQSFLSALNIHLQDTNEIDSFYYEILCKYADILGESNPKRLIVEAFAKILKFEGTGAKYSHCFMCDRPIGQSVILGKGFAPAHEECLRGIVFAKESVIELLEQSRSIYFEDSDIDKLYEIVLRGF